MVLRFHWVDQVMAPASRCSFDTADAYSTRSFHGLVDPLSEHLIFVNSLFDWLLPRSRRRQRKCPTRASAVGAVRK